MGSITSFFSVSKHHHPRVENTPSQDSWLSRNKKMLGIGTVGLVALASLGAAYQNYPSRVGNDGDTCPATEVCQAPEIQKQCPAPGIQKQIDPENLWREYQAGNYANLKGSQELVFHVQFYSGQFFKTIQQAAHQNYQDNWAEAAKIISENKNLGINNVNIKFQEFVANYNINQKLEFSEKISKYIVEKAPILAKAGINQASKNVRWIFRTLKDFEVDFFWLR